MFSRANIAKIQCLRKWYPWRRGSIKILSVFEAFFGSSSASTTAWTVPRNYIVLETYQALLCHPECCTMLWSKWHPTIDQKRAKHLADTLCECKTVPKVYLWISVGNICCGWIVVSLYCLIFFVPELKKLVMVLCLFWIAKNKWFEIRRSKNKYYTVYILWQLHSCIKKIPEI